MPPGKVAHFAGEARVTDAADMGKVSEDKRLTLMVSLVHTAATGARDDVVAMFCKRMAAIHKKGRDHLEALREVHQAESERLLGVFGDVLSVVREAMTPSEEACQRQSGRRGGLSLCGREEAGGTSPACETENYAECVRGTEPGP